MSTNSNDPMMQELKISFGLASLSREARLHLSGYEWRHYQKLESSFAKKREALNRDYSREYKTRVEGARRRLIDKAGSKTLDFKHKVFGHDVFDARALMRQAQREVRFEHEAQLRTLGTNEMQAKESFLDGCTHRRKQRGKARGDFSDANKLDAAAVKQRTKQRTR